ncbi:MAG: DUF192 domain-containing protein [Candidatus Micrarchaeota archaeon]|nr:DUF192 domain-containing protein [Candidatus Micrarchaeota archaeon]
MNSSAPIIIGVISTVLLIAIIYSLTTQTKTASYSQFGIGGKNFTLTYVATNQASWEHGLMNTTITNATTMLFVFPTPANYPFWMLDTYSNLDMIWINGSTSSGKIVYIAANATSCFNPNLCTIYNPNRLANFVIEAKAGFVKRNNVSLGQVVLLR